METPLFTIRECGKGPVVAGLEFIQADNASLTRLATDKPIAGLAVGEATIGRAGRESYEVVRVS